MQGHACMLFRVRHVFLYSAMIEIGAVSGDSMSHLPQASLAATAQIRLGVHERSGFCIATSKRSS